jgi:hypothetical protein
MLIVSGCDSRSSRSTEQEKRTVTELTEDLKTRCVGRYLIDAPESVNLSGAAKLNGVDVYAQPMSHNEYLRQIQERAALLKTTKSRYQYLYADAKPDIPDSRYFISLGSFNESSDANRVIEAYKWDHGYRIKLQIIGSDWTNSIDKDEPVIKNDPVKTDVPEKTQRVISLLSRVRGRADDVIPSEPGVCFLGGFIPGSARAFERVETSFVLPDKPDVSFVLTTDAAIHEPTTLLKRSPDVEAALKETKGRTVRKGRVQLAGFAETEEWLIASLMPQNVQGHTFALEANSTVGSAKTPLVNLDMENGGIPPNFDPEQVSRKASLTEAEAIAFWDAVSRTLRPRPNGF